MENDNKTLAEVFMDKFLSDKRRLMMFIIGLASLICSVIYLISASVSGTMLFYMLCLIAAAVSNIIYVFDIDNKRKYSGDILMIGMALCFIGMFLRTIRFGLMFSWQDFIINLAFSLVLLMMFTGFARNKIKHDLYTVLLILMAAVSFFTALYIKFVQGIGGVTFIYFRLAEVFMFIDYIFVTRMQKDEGKNFADRLGPYKTQIPAMRVTGLCTVFICAVALVIGVLTDMTDSRDTVSKTVTVQEEKAENADMRSETPKSNMASGTVSGTASPAVTASAVPSNEITAAQNNDIAEITAGQTVSTRDYEFTLNRVEFSYKVTPDNPPSYYTYYEASEGQVYIYLNASIKNTQKQSIGCDEVYSVVADYNNGYTYRGSFIADDADGDFTYANITSIDPLQTLGVHCLIACPEEVSTSDAPLFLTITMKDGTKYKYTIR